MKAVWPFGHSITARVTAVILAVGAAPLLLASGGITWLVTDDKEAALVDSAIGHARDIRRDVEQRIELSRAELQSIAIAADHGRLLTVPELASDLLAVRAMRGDVELVRGGTTTSQSGRLGAMEWPQPGTVTLLDDETAVVATTVDEVRAVALLDLGPSLRVPQGWQSRLVESEAGQTPAVTARRGQLRGKETVTTVAPTSDGISVMLRAPIAPARAAARELVRDTVLLALLALIPLVLLGGLLAKHVMAPVRRLAEVVRTASGPVELPPLPPDEVGDLGAAIAAMSERLHDDARILRGAVRFGRKVGGLDSPEAVLRRLRALLTDSFPQVRWVVLSASDVATGRVPPDCPIGADALRELANDASPGCETAGNKEPGSSTTRILTHDRDGQAPFVLTLASSRHLLAVVVGEGAELTDPTVRMLELLCRTAATALDYRDLQRAALSNEKLALLGRMTASVAHELNNPLSVVSMSLAVLDEEVEGEAREFVQEARGGCKRLAQIVSDLSSVSRGGEMRQRELVSLEELSRGVAKAATQQRHGAQIRVEAPRPTYAWCDHGRIEQIALNLVLNAVDATPEGEVPAVTLRVHEPGEGVAIDVSDNGTGIPPELRDRIFEPFFTTKGNEGTGLGLFLARAFAEAQHGSLEIIETGPEGTTFRLSLPGADAPTGDPSLRDGAPATDEELARDAG